MSLHGITSENYTGNIIQRKKLIEILLQETAVHWSQGLKASMQDPKMQVAIVKSVLMYLN